MARKKGGKKKRTDSVKSDDAGQAQPEADAGPAERKDAIPDAVSEVLATPKADKKEKRSTKKLKTQLAKLTADGYDVSALEALLETGSTEEFKEALSNFEKGIEGNRAINEAMATMDLSGFEKEVGDINDMLSDPTRHGEAAEVFGGIRLKRMSGEIMSELEKMVLPAMKPRVDAMKAMLQTSADIGAVESEFSKLMADYKAAYAEEGVKAQIATGPQPAQPGARIRMPMAVKDIFLLYKDGRFISHHTNRVVTKEQQKDLFADLKTGRDFLRSPKYQPQKLNVIPGRARNILVQSGRFTVVIVVAEGSVDPWSEKITSKVITLMEKEDQTQLKDWNGDVSALKSSGKYMQALLFAFMKLAKKGQ